MKNKIIGLGAIIISTTSCVPAAIVGAGVGSRAIVDERSMGHIVDDASITAKIKNEYAHKSISHLFSKISVTVKEGRVLLTGSVPAHKDTVQASQLAWKVQGVKEVINEVIVSEKDLKTRANDTSIATQVRAKLLFQKDLRSVNYTVEANNGVVYLIGIAQNQHELNLALNVAREVKGVKKVVSHVTLKSDPRRSDI